MIKTVGHSSEKVVFLGDAHWGARGNSDFFLARQLDFYHNVFFPWLIENDIKQVVQMGDLLDQRKSVNVKILQHLRRDYLQRFEDLKIQQLILLGNHDVMHNNTNDVSALVEIAGKTSNYKYTTVVTDPLTLTVDGCRIDLIPWINAENSKQILDFVKNSTSDYLAGHLEVNGFEMVSGITCKAGFEPNVFKHYTEVFSGHFHIANKIRNIRYLGTPYQLNAGDAKDSKGFWVLDTKTRAMDFIINPVVIYKSIDYDDRVVDYSGVDVAQYKNCIVKVTVTSNENDLVFDQFIARLQQAAYSMKISSVDTFDVSDVEVDQLDVEDSLSILIRAVDETPSIKDKDSVKMKINAIHKETLDAMISE